MAQHANFRCYTCKQSHWTKTGLVRYEGHLHCKNCVKALQEQPPQQAKVGRRFQTMLDRLLPEK
jgi:hypothetical protein